MNVEFASYLQRRIDGLEKGIGYYGGPEIQEALMLAFLEIQAHYLRPKALKNNPFEVRDFWSVLISDYVGRTSNLTLTYHLKDVGVFNNVSFPGILGAFARAYQTEFPPEEQ